jgi:hypothetical protein
MNSSEDSDYVYESQLDSGSDVEPCNDLGDDIDDDDVEYCALEEIADEPSIKESLDKIIQSCSCSSSCVDKSQQKLIVFLQNISNMHKEQQRLSLMTSLAMLRAMCSDTAKRKRFAFQLPIVGTVCRDVFASAYGLSVRTLMRSLKSIDSGIFFFSGHGLVDNKNAQKIDKQWLIDWFKDFAAVVGEVVLLRVRRQCDEVLTVFFVGIV